ncbi:hypothetical protein [uncultured Pseudodesulfovibrio sp.]|uniref:hypothetical protein n=1 Tax=uncultured Pseudodesulfovibrio sp. TaxID=2035858 RepID=UPI0029C92015|nr:hypothetical protein [uncultured Pseudodesulfovibrio sp.]
MALTTNPYATDAEVGSMDSTTAQKKGLGTGSNIMQAGLQRQQAYPQSYTSQMQGPAQANYYDYTAPGQMNTVSGLEGGDYAKLTQSLQQPILSQHNQAMAGINDQYSARGLYGSTGGGMMSQAQGAQNQATQNALSNAVATGYGLQLQDQSQQIDQNKASWAAGLANAQDQNTYNQNALNYNLDQQNQQAQWNNSLLEQDYNQALNELNWQNTIDEQNFQRAMQLAGQGNSGAVASQQLQAAQDQADANTNAAIWGSVGNLASSATSGLMDNLWDSIF